MRHYWTTETFTEQARRVHKNRYQYDRADYKGTKTKIVITCPIHGDFQQQAGTHLRGTGCPRCSGNYILTFEEFVTQAQKIHLKKYDYSEAQYLNGSRKIQIICPTHGSFKQLPVAHLRGQGCLLCCGKQQIDLLEFVERATKIHGNKYTYNRADYINDRTKISITCPKHGDFQQKPNKHLFGNGCPKCVGSTGEQLIQNFLNSKGISSSFQYKIADCRKQRPLPFDFALFKGDNLVGLIEYHGEQHYRACSFGSKSPELVKNRFIDIQSRDVIKAKYCAENNIPLLTIPYWQKDNITGLLDKYIQENIC